MTQDTKSTVLRIYSEVINGRKLDALDELTTPDVIEHEETPGLAPGREGVKQFFAMLATAFPDFRMNVEDVIVEGDKGVGRSTLTGTHQGDFMGIPATNRSINLTVIDIFRVDNGRVAEHWGAMDSGAMMEQLGVAPPA